MPVASLPQVDLYYELHGPPGAPALLLIHGAVETFRSQWAKQVPAFSKKYRLIGVDLRGHGRSTNPAGRLDLRQMADDLYQLLHYLDYRKAHACGFSGGASVALFLALRHADCLRSLVLVSNNFEKDKIRTGASRFWDPERVAKEEPEWWKAAARRHKTSVASLLRWWAEEDTLRPDFSGPELGSIGVSCLVVGGDRDPIIPLAQTVRLFQALPDASLCVLPGQGHGIPRRCPQVFNRIVLDFLSRVDDRGS